MKAVISLAPALLFAACAPSASMGTGALPVQTGQTWTVATQSFNPPARTSIEVEAIVAGPEELSYMRYSPSLDALLALLLDHSAPAALSYNTDNRELRFVWRQGTPSVLFTCKITRPDTGSRQWAGELRIAGEAAGACTAALQ